VKRAGCQESSRRPTKLDNIEETAAMSAVPEEFMRAARVDNPLARDAIEGLSARRKSLPCTWLYDRRGSELFEQITELPEYTAFRAECTILERFAPQVGAAVGPQATVIEYGSGSSRRTTLLLSALDRPALYLRADIDTTALPPLPSSIEDRPRLGFLPGSTLGHSAPDAAIAVLARLGRQLGAGARLLVGVDGTQDPALLIPAYDDPLGVTAAFNRNLLTRLNRELGASFDLERFEHEARWNERERCIEMHLVSRESHTVALLGRAIEFDAGESIRTESSYKYSPLRVQAMAHVAGWRTRRVFADEHTPFNAYLLERGS
jgi:uncharacterized SAM-dependent methyltransferase